MARVLCRLVLLLAVAVVPAQAMPAYTHDAAAKWADQTAKSDIQPANRIYVFGPDTWGYSGGKNNTPLLFKTDHLHAVEFKSGLTLAEVLKQLPDEKQQLGISVYRAPDESDFGPCYMAKVGDPSVSSFRVHPRDIIHLYLLNPSPPLQDAN